jgi:death on curing protein
MISIELVLKIHDQAIKLFGGSSGIRDKGALEAAINRPFQTFGDDDLYPSAIEKAATIGESIIMNHPFVDGNKRTGFILLETILIKHNLKIVADKDQIYLFVIDISTGEKRFETIVEWLKNNTAIK